VLLVVLTGSCATVAAPTPRNSDASPALQAVLVASELAVSEQRVPVGILELQHAGKGSHLRSS
jgi:hypothetical protein